MRILFRYIGIRLVWGWLLVLLILAALFSILELVCQYHLDQAKIEAIVAASATPDES